MDIFWNCTIINKYFYFQVKDVNEIIQSQTFLLSNVIQLQSACQELLPWDQQDNSHAFLSL